MRSILLLLSLSAAAFFACTPPEYSAGKKKSKEAVNLDLRDKQVQKLYNFRDEHRVDSLVSYLKNEDPTLRYLAAIAFASLRDSSAVPALASLLADPVEEVRHATAFALGQTGARSAEKFLIDAFDAGDSLSEHQRFNALVLEAVGKCGSLASLKNIASVTTYQTTDTLLLEGQCRAIYRFGLRGITHPDATAKMVGYVTDVHYPAPARLMAAHYLARGKEVAIDSAQAVQVAAAFVRSSDPNIRMALARALGRSNTQPAFGILSKAIGNEQDWRVKCNIINALSKFEYDTVRSLVSPLITDANAHVSRTAAEFFIANGQAKDGDYYWRIARDNGALPWATQVALYHASNKWLSGKIKPESKDYVNYRLREIYQQSKNPYERAACLNALAEFGWQYRYIHDKGFNDPHPAVKTAATEALLNIAKRSDFYSFFGESAKGVRRELYYYLREVVASGDPGMIATGASGFQIETLNFRTLRDSARIDDLNAALQKLKLPRDYEAYTALAGAIAYFEGQPAPAPYKIPYNHPIDWKLLDNVTAATRATIKTGKGSVVIEFYPHWAPGSVANFIQLASTGYYDGKTFHRVVPNFVVQGGCPRGDGSGSPDYSIRTEIGQVWYDNAGYVGMASAGADTEGSQFFFTHSATPHLDGNYTIFARVVQGQDIVDQLQVGDVMEKVTVGAQ